jgi:hypothetical protein
MSSGYLDITGNDGRAAATPAADQRHAARIARHHSHDRQVLQEGRRGAR